MFKLFCDQVQNALKEQPEGSTLPRVIERESWKNEKFSSGLDHLRLAKSVSDIIQNIQRNKRKGSPHWPLALYHRFENYEQYDAIVRKDVWWKAADNFMIIPSESRISQKKCGEIRFTYFSAL